MPAGATRPDVIIVARGGGVDRGSVAVQRGNRGTRRGGIGDPADLGGGARNGYDADRLRRGCACTDADGGSGNGGAGAGESARLSGGAGGAEKKRRAHIAAASGGARPGACTRSATASAACRGHGAGASMAWASGYCMPCRAPCNCVRRNCGGWRHRFRRVSCSRCCSISSNARRIWGRCLNR